MIVVTGASGRLGRSIVKELVRLVPPERVGVSVRSPAQVADLAEAGVRVRRGDFAEPGSLADAFEGASQVLLVSSNAAATGGDPLAQHRAAIDAARSAGARRIVYTSHMAASPTSSFPPARDHAATEQMLRDSGVAWTALRNGFYVASGIGMMGGAPKSGVLDAPDDGKVSWTAHADLALAAATILAQEGRYEGPTPPLAAPEALDFADLARIASELLGRPLERRVSSDEAFRSELLAAGAPPSRAALFVGYFVASRSGEFLATDGTLEALLGRRPTRVRDVMARELAR